LILTPEAEWRMRRLALRRSRYRGRRSVPSLAGVRMDELFLAGLIGRDPVSGRAGL